MPDYTPILVAVIAAIPGTLAAVLAYLSLRRSSQNATGIQGVKSDIEVVRTDVNDKMQQFLKTTKKAAHAEGMLQERENNTIHLSKSDDVRTGDQKTRNSQKKGMIE